MRASSVGSTSDGNEQPSGGSSDEKGEMVAGPGAHEGAALSWNHASAPGSSLASLRAQGLATMAAVGLSVPSSGHRRTRPRRHAHGAKAAGRKAMTASAEVFVPGALQDGFGAVSGPPGLETHEDEDIPAAWALSYPSPMGCGLIPPPPGLSAADEGTWPFMHDAQDAQEVHATAHHNELSEALSRLLADFMVPAHMGFPEKAPPCAGYPWQPADEGVASCQRSGGFKVGASQGGDQSVGVMPTLNGERPVRPCLSQAER